MGMNENEGSSAYPPNPDVKSGSCLIAGFQPLTVVHPSYWNAYKTESGATFSIDMVRLKLSFINGKGEWLSTHAQTFDCDKKLSAAQSSITSLLGAMDSRAASEQELRECESKWKSLEAEYRARSNI